MGIHPNRLPLRRMAFATIAVAMLVPACAGRADAQSGGTAAGGASSAAPAPSVLDKIRAKMREANAPDDRATRWFNNLDTDKNDEITKQELFESLRQRFEALDENRDGVVSTAEYLKLRKDPGAGTRRFGELDSNKDGRLSMEEFASPADWRFDRIDRNLDGKVSPTEAQRLFDRPTGADDQSGACFYVDRQIIRVDKETAEKYRKLGYPKADCFWTPDAIEQEKTKEQAK